MRRLLLVLAFSGMTALCQDNATVLARILAAKGTISTSELAQVESAAPGDRVGVLAALLQQKGLLTASEVASIGVRANDGEIAQANRTATVSTSQLARAGAGTVQTPATRGTATGTPASAPNTSAGVPVTAQSKIPVTIYGTILMNAFMNDALGNVTDIPLFLSKQGSDALGNDKTFGMTARQSRIGARIQAGNVAGGLLTAQVEVDFLGGKAPFGNGVNMDLLRLRLAYGRIDWQHFSFEAGQDWSIFAPLNPTSLAEYAIPLMSASGNPWIRMPQIRGDFHGKMSDRTKWLAQFAAIDPNMGDYGTATFTATRPPGAGERGRAPGVETRLALTASEDDRDFIVGISGHYAHGKNSGTIGPTTVQYPFDSWGVALDYTLPFTKLFNITGEAYTGRELGIFSVTSGEGYLAPGSPGDRGVHSSGGWIQGQFNFTRQWQLNLAYGLDDPRVRDLPPGNRSRNQTYIGNVMYKYNPHFTIAWEYRRLLTDYRNQILANERGDNANMAFAYIF